MCDSWPPFLLEGGSEGEVLRKGWCLSCSSDPRPMHHPPILVAAADTTRFQYHSPGGVVDNKNVSPCFSKGQLERVVYRLLSTCGGG